MTAVRYLAWVLLALAVLTASLRSVTPAAYTPNLARLWARLRIVGRLPIA